MRASNTNKQNKTKQIKNKQIAAYKLVFVIFFFM